MRAAAAATLAAALLAAYLPDVGHGFISDDFSWIVESRVSDPGELAALLGTARGGFYRPIVSATFAVDHSIWALNPFGYALTNLALAVVDAWLVYAVARRFVAPAAAMTAGAVWLFNFHGINMALLWLSGRTSLLVVLFSAAALLAVLDGRWRLAGALCLGALLSKEEAAVLPALLTGLVWADGRLQGSAPTLRRLARDAWPLWAALALYAALRLQSGAMVPANAPSFYQWSWAPGLVLRNVLEYADRSGTFAAAVSLIMLGVAWRAPGAWSPAERRLLLLGALWLPAAFATTILLPVRSSLYVLLPSVGSALIAAACAARAARLVPARFGRTAIALTLLPLLLLPVYRSRNERWVNPAELSAHVVSTIVPAARAHGGAGSIVLLDDYTTAVNLEAAIAGLAPEMAALMLPPGWQVMIVPPGEPAPSGATLTYRLQDGRLVAETATPAAR